MAEKLQSRVSTAAEWTSSDPVLEQGEIGIESDTLSMKVGDGSSLWSALAYYGSMPTGAIIPFGDDTAPSGYLSCDGTAVSRTTYAALFGVIGTTWGVGDGSTTFNVPDLRGAFLRGTGSHGSETMANGNPYAGPSVGSFEDDQMQGHYHRQNANNNGSNTLGGVSYVRGRLGGNTTDTGVYEAESDGTNGTPRTGDETKSFAAGVLWVIKT